MRLKESDIVLLLSSGESQELEFKRSPSSSVARSMVSFANAKGGKIIFGVNDKNHVVGIEDINRTTSAIQSIARNCEPAVLAEVYHLRFGEKSILVANIPTGDKKPYSCHDGYFLRVGATSQKMNRDELVAFVQKNIPVAFDNLICPAFTQSDFDERAFHIFLEKSRINTGGLDSLNILSNLGLVSLSDKKEPAYRNTTVLFFGKEPARFIPQSVITCVLFSGTDKVNILDRKDFNGNLPENIQQAMLFLNRHLSLRYEIKSLVRKEILELPEQALREALLNAVSHRDYSAIGSVVMVEIYRNRVEIVSPGGLPVGLKPAELGKKSVHRNPLIADMLHRMGEVEKVGSGIPRILSATKEAKVPKPQFEADGFFTVVFPKAKNVGQNKSRAQSGAQSRAQLSLILSALRETPLSANELVAALHLRSKTGFFKRTIKELLDQHLIEQKLPDKPNSRLQKYLLTKKGRDVLKRKK